jgi:hypothetical protein
MIPKEPGVYDLGNYFQWVFFNPASKKYDTLRSKQVVEVSGESQKNQSIESTDLGSFYDQIALADNTLRPRTEQGWMRLSTNILLVLLAGASGILLFKKNK